MNLDSQLAQLENAQLVHPLSEEELAYLFKHALTQESAYQTLLIKKRQEIHRWVAQSIELLYPDRLDENAVLLVQHYTETSDDTKIFEYAARAAERAARLFAYPEARLYYVQALQSLSRLEATKERERRRVELLLGQVAVALRADGPDANLARLREAESLHENLPPQDGDQLQLARIYYWTGHAYIHKNETREAVRYMHQVLTLAQTSNVPQLLASAASVIGRTLMAQGQFGRAIPVLSQAISALELTEDEHELVLATGFRGVAYAAQGEYARGIAEGERALARAMASNTLTGISLGHGLLGIIYLFGKDLSHGLEHARAIIDNAEKSGDWLHLYMAFGFQAWALMLDGHCTDAASSMDRSMGIASKMGGQLVFSDWFTAARAEMALRCGDNAAAIVLAQAALDSADRIGGLFSGGLAHRVWAQALAAVPEPLWNEIWMHLESSLNFFSQGDAMLEVARTHYVWGRLVQAQGNGALALAHFDKAASQFEASGLIHEWEQTRERYTQVATSIA